MPQALFLLLAFTTFTFTNVHPAFHIQSNAWARYKYCVNDTCFNSPDTVLFFFESISMNGGGGPNLVRSGFQRKKNIQVGDTLWGLKNMGRTFISFGKEPGKESDLVFSNQDERFLGKGVVKQPDSSSMEIRLSVHDLDSPSIHRGVYSYVEYYKQVSLPKGIKLLRK